MILSLPVPPIFSCWTQTWLREFALIQAMCVWSLILQDDFCVELLRRTDNYEKGQIIDLSWKSHSLYTFMYMFPVSVSA